VVPSCILAAAATVCSLVGLLRTGGAGRTVVLSTRGVEVTLYGEGLYAADTWLIGVGNRGQDAAMLLVGVPVLLLTLWRTRRGEVVTRAVLTGVLAFFTYYYASMTFGTAQNRLFPVYVAAASLAGFALVNLLARMDVVQVARALPLRPGRLALATYLLAVGAALALAWLPRFVSTAVTGDIGPAVGPYTAMVTDALDLGLVLPVAVIGAVQLLRHRPAGRLLAVVMLVVNVCIGTVLIGQGAAQLAGGVPLTPPEIAAKMVTFALLTLVAGGMLSWMAWAGHRRQPTDGTGSAK
jgi:hypothetical protein